MTNNTDSKLQFDADRERIAERIGGGFYPEIAIGDGWMPILVKLDNALACIQPDYVIHQVKEKFGTLRFYYDESIFNGSFDDWPSESERGMAEALIGKAITLSSVTCEVCGERGWHEVEGGWIKTLCGTHHAIRKGMQREARI